MKRKTFFRLVLLCAIVVILLAAFVGSSLGKYKTTIELSSNVSFSAKLADELILQETIAQKQTDGSYRLVGGSTTNNQYILLPGVNIPKDPYVEIIGKTDIPASLFIEIVDEIGNEAISYKIKDCWLKLEGATGKNSGEVYVYAEGGSAKTISSDISYIDILERNQVVVGQNLKFKNSVSDVLSFYACLGETAMGNSPWEVYKAVYNMP